MKIADRGVTEPSYIDFMLPSDFAKKSLYYISQYGHFYCTQDYSICRESLDMYLFVYITKGVLTFETQNRKYDAAANQIVLLDCHKPHRYYCTESAEFLWFHFIGNNSSEYTQYLHEQQGMLFDEPYVKKLRPCFEAVLAGARSMMPNEHYISQNIAVLFSRLAAPTSSQTPFNHPLNPAIRYITEHFDEDISIPFLADLCSVSISHFIRSFRSYTGYTPHEYLLAYRLRQAKQLLLVSKETVENIAVQCGFNSASHFARAFRKTEQMSPTQFRTLLF